MTLRRMISKVVLLLALIGGIFSYSNNIFADNLASLKTEQNIVQNNNKANQVKTQKENLTKQKSSSHKKYQLQQNIITPNKNKRCSGFVMTIIVVGIAIFMYLVFSLGGLI